jgi:hypothetical protein
MVAGMGNLGIGEFLLPENLDHSIGWQKPLRNAPFRIMGA